MRRAMTWAPLALVCCVTAALADMPATDEQTICDFPTLVTGTIVDAQSRDCWLKPDHDKYCDREIEISLLVDRVLKGPSPLRSTEVLRAYAAFSNALPLKEGDWTMPMNDLFGAFSFPATGKPLGSDEARRALIGRRIIFAYFLPVPEPYTNNLVFPIERLAWIKRVITDPRCDKLSPWWQVEDE